MAPSRIPCPACGAANRDADPFCYLCGKPFALPEPGPGAALPIAPVPSPAGEGGTGGGAIPAPAGPSGAGPIPRPGDAFRRIPILSFDEAAAANARNSLLLFLLLLALFFALGAGVGAAAGRPETGIALALLLYAILAATAWFNGPAVVLAAHGAREADPEAHRVLLNAAAEMAIAAGLPPPRVYVIESDGLNAFAAGRRPREGAVAVTTALLGRLEREELQGVLAHELAHIKSRDTLYTVCAAVLVGAVALLADTFLRGSLLGGRSGRGAGRGSIPQILLGLLLALFAPLAARLLQMSLSRQREYHADAAAARFTRNPLGLASALGKIAAAGAGVPGENRATRHLFIVSPLESASGRAQGLLSTHPPTERRIERLKKMAGLGQALPGTARRTDPTPTTGGREWRTS